MKRTKQGFTLIELMIVIAIIAILMATTFKLIAIAQKAKATAVTTARLERLQNALSGYYAAYGMYPAVPLYGNPDPGGTDQVNEEDGSSVSSGTQASAQASARAQPVAFEYPTPVKMDDKIPLIFLPDNVISVNTAIGSLSSDLEEGTDWGKYKAFKFGLMSFLLPRVQTVGLPGKGPLEDVFKKAQWMVNNPSSKVTGAGAGATLELNTLLDKQLTAENEAAIRWLPCFDGVLNSFAGSLSGVNVNGGSGLMLKKRQMTAGPKVALAYSTITDGWGREFFYHSAPPYQSFRIWSAGPDGLTFPPWIPSTDATYKSLKAHTWLKDDIVSGKMTL
jgi:prepilin-type N-terminal cleavage/methylation domain-containing protein